MSDPLYAKDLLRLAAMADGAGTLTAPDSKGAAQNPACGDRVEITLHLDSKGAITELAHETRACVLAQASASILGAHAIGADKRVLHALKDSVTAMLNSGDAPPEPFADYAALKGAVTFPGRHTCVLLPIDAVLNALENKPA